MTYFVQASQDAITMRMALEQVTFKINGQDVVMQKLPMSLPFSRKAINLRDMSGGEMSTVYVFKRIDMDPLGFDDFARNLCRDTEWLKGQCHALPIIRLYEVKTVISMI